ncbi:MAG: DNA repair protein [Massilimicrobiota timonensis]
MDRIYLCIDLKSFYASVECAERGIDPFEINLVVADPSRGGGAITLAATPAIKKLGVPSRGRIYEIPKDIEYIIAPPRMSLYMEYSAKIYGIMLKYISADDIHVYSCDEAFLDVTTYLSLYKKTAKQIAQMILDDILKETNITATVGIGSNLYLAKVALDITAKHSSDNMGYLDEGLYRQLLWHHKPLTDFWHVGPGTANRLAMLGIDDMAGIAHCDENVLYKIFGVNAEYLIDHSWGREPCTIEDIKAYKPKANSISNSQILFEDYKTNDAFLVMKEMVDVNVLQLTENHLVTNHISLFIGYSKNVIKPSRGSRKIGVTTNSCKLLMEEFILLFKKIIVKDYPIRQIAISFGNLKDEYFEQYNLFTDMEDIDKERRLQQTLVFIQNKYGKNAVLKGMNFYDKATQRKRNTLIGGHNAK